MSSTASLGETTAFAAQAASSARPEGRSGGGASGREKAESPAHAPAAERAARRRRLNPSPAIKSSATKPSSSQRRSFTVAANRGLRVSGSGSRSLDRVALAAGERHEILPGHGPDTWHDPGHPGWT